MEVTGRWGVRCGWGKEDVVEMRERGGAECDHPVNQSVSAC